MVLKASLERLFADAESTAKPRNSKARPRLSSEQFSLEKHLNALLSRFVSVSTSSIAAQGNVVVDNKLALAKPIAPQSTVPSGSSHLARRCNKPQMRVASSKTA